MVLKVLVGILLLVMPQNLMATSLYSESARATAKIEAGQHLDELRKQGALGLQETRPIKIIGRKPIGGDSKIIHLIRHGQGFHNLLGDVYRDFGKSVDSTGDKNGESPYRRPEIVDPPLTTVGRDQAKALQGVAKNIDLVVCSPLLRALQTAALAFPDERSSVPWIAHPDAREASGVNTCDMHRAKSEIQDDFPFLDLSLISENDDYWTPDARESAKTVSDRAYNLLLWIKARKESNIVIATHSAYLFTLLNTAITCEPPELANWFLTGELRSIAISFSED